MNFQQPIMNVENYRPLAELVPAHWQSGIVVLDDGARIHYTRAGDLANPAVVLLHGVQVSGVMWLRTAQALEADYHIIMPDSRGHGQSSTMTPNSVLADDVAGLLRALNVENPVVVGHSMGADVAGRFAAAYPTRAVMLVDPALRSFGPPPSDEIPAYMQPVIDAMNALKSQTHAERLITAQRLLPPGTPPLHEADYVSFVEGMAQFDMNTFRAFGAITPLFADSATIARITAPIILLTARPMRSPSAEPDVTPFSEHWQNGRHVHFPDSGHFIPFEQFDHFIEVLRALLSETA